MKKIEKIGRPKEEIFIFFLAAQMAIRMKMKISCLKSEQNIIWPIVLINVVVVGQRDIIVL